MGWMVLLVMGGAGAFQMSHPTVPCVRWLCLPGPIPQLLSTSSLWLQAQETPHIPLLPQKHAEHTGGSSNGSDAQPQATISAYRP